MHWMHIRRRVRARAIVRIQIGQQPRTVTVQYNPLFLIF
jgi:hypothetical protein